MDQSTGITSAELIRAALAAIIAVASAWCGGYYGSAGAQRVAERNQLRRDLERQLQATNLAISYSRASAFVATEYWKDFASNMSRTYYRERELFLEVLKKLETAPSVPSIPTTIISVKRPLLNTGLVQSLLTEHLLIGGLAVVVFAALEQANDNLTEAWSRRQQIIDEHESGRRPLDLPRYFGVQFETPTGSVTDSIMQGSVDGITAGVQDLVEFSIQLSYLLEEHGNGLRQKFEDEFTTKPPVEVLRVDFSGLKAHSWTSETLEKVFDKPTPKTLAELINRKIRTPEI